MFLDINGWKVTMAWMYPLTNISIITKNKISDYIYNAVLDGNATAMVIGFHWAKFLLGFSFHPAEMERGNKFVLYNINIQQSEGIVEYRRTCWKILISLALNTAWKDAVLLFLDSYADYLRCKPDYEIVSSEVEYIDKLLSILKCDRISYLRIIQSLLLNGKKMNVNYNEKWAELLIGKEWSLYQLLENNFVSSGLEYKEYEKKKKYINIRVWKKYFGIGY